MSFAKRVVPAVLFAFAASAPALAFEDEATGLKVDLPGDFIVEKSVNSRPDYEALVGINTTSGVPAIAGTGSYICEVGFQAAPQNASLTQEEINAAIADPSWPEMAKASMGQIFEFSADEPFDLAGITGYEFVGTPKMGPDAANVRIVLSMLETPKGRTAITCATSADEFETAHPIFRTIRDGVTPPA